MKQNKTMTEAMMKLDNKTRNLRCAYCGKYPFPSSKEDEMTDTQSQIIGPSRLGKSALVTNTFLAQAKAGRSVKFEAMDYVALSRKAYENLLARSRQEAVEEIEEYCIEQYDKQLKKETHDSSSAYARVISFIEKLKSLSKEEK